MSGELEQRRDMIVVARPSRRERVELLLGQICRARVVLMIRLKGTEDVKPGKNS